MAKSVQEWIRWIVLLCLSVSGAMLSYGALVQEVKQNSAFRVKAEDAIESMSRKIDRIYTYTITKEGGCLKDSQW